MLPLGHPRTWVQARRQCGFGGVWAVDAGYDDRLVRVLSAVWPLDVWELVRQIRSMEAAQRRAAGLGNRGVVPDRRGAGGRGGTRGGRVGYRAAQAPRAVVDLGGTAGVVGAPGTGNGRRRSGHVASPGGLRNALLRVRQAEGSSVPNDDQARGFPCKGGINPCRLLAVDRSNAVKATSGRLTTVRLQGKAPRRRQNKTDRHLRS